MTAYDFWPMTPPCDLLQQRIRLPGQRPRDGRIAHAGPEFIFQTSDDAPRRVSEDERDRELIGQFDVAATSSDGRSPRPSRTRARNEPVPGQPDPRPDLTVLSSTQPKPFERAGDPSRTPPP